MTIYTAARPVRHVLPEVYIDFDIHIIIISSEITSNRTEVLAVVQRDFLKTVTAELSKPGCLFNAFPKPGFIPVERKSADVFPVHKNDSK